jgi:hypothetical protein
MKPLFAILVISAVALSSLRAEEAPAATTTIELKNKSSFTMEGSGRNPFWPIGFKPVARVQQTEHTGPEILPSAFVLTSVTVGGGAKYAIINGKVMEEGQQFGLQLGTQTYQLTVKSIEDGRVILTKRDQEIIVPLRRK